MKKKIKINQFAKKLVEFSKEDGLVTEAGISEVLTVLKQVQHRYPLATLKAFLHYARREIKLQTAVVSAPAKLNEASLKSIETYLTQQYDRPIHAVLEQDDSLIAGVQVRVADDVYDASVAGHLKRLAENVH